MSEDWYSTLMRLDKRIEERRESINNLLDSFKDPYTSPVKKEEDEDEKVTLRVQQEGTVDFYFTMNRNERLRKLMIAYCERRKLGDYRSLRFHLNGDRITGNQTPNELELENNDVIDAWSDQMGGARALN